MRDRRLLYAAILCTVLGLLLLSLIGCASSTLGKSLNVGVGVSKTADQIMTDRGEARGAHEGNRIVGDAQWRQLLMGVVGVSGVIAVAGLVEQERHPILAHVIRGAAIGVWTFAAIHNAGVIR